MQAQQLTLLNPLSIIPSQSIHSTNTRITSNGRAKAEKANAFRSYTDYLSVKNYFLNGKSKENSLRNIMMLDIGVGCGLRISDIFSLRYRDFFNQRKEFYQDLRIHELKTGKSTSSADDLVLITEAVRKSISSYLDYVGWDFSLDDFLFKSKLPQKNKYVEEDGVSRINPLYGQYVLTPSSGHRIMKDAQRDLNLPINVGSHTLRKTFLTLAVLIGDMKFSHMSSIGLEIGQIMDLS